MIEVELPDGRVVEINTTDPSVAAQAAQKFLASSAPKPDKYQQAAIDEQANLKAKGIDPGAGLTRRLAHGATLGADSTIMAAAMTPLEMFKRGINPIEGYNYAKAREDQIMGDARKNTGALGTAAEVLGGGISGAGLASGGITAARFLSPEAGLLARTGASAADAAGLGAFSGAMEGNGLAERGMNALKGGLLGGVLGWATPAALSLGGVVASPIISNIRARINPTGFAQSQVARAGSESGMTPAQIAGEVRTAATEGQNMFTAADAMGNAGQRLLATTARSPGQARTDVVNFLDNRQAGQGRRVSGALSEGFGSRLTPDQMRTAMTAERGAMADDAYGAVRADAGRTDIVPAINTIDRTIGTGPGQALQATNDSVEGALRPFRERLARVNPDDFEAVQRIRFDMADAAQNARQTGYNNRAREIGNAVRELDAAMENASSGYRQANRNFAAASRNIDAVDQGREAAMRGRTEDIIPAFQALPPRGQQAYRTGYVDPLIQQTQGAAFGANKARPLINDAFADEAAVIAPGNALMQRRIGRENTMFQTRNAAQGNSKTVENANDDAAMGLDPTVIGSLVTQVGSGNFSGALRTMLGAGQNAWTGNTPAVRQAVADILLTRGGNVNAAQFQRMLDETVQRIQNVQRMARSMGRGAAGGLAVTGPGQSRR
ncbi:hypothetical protein GWE18_00400 [Bradyrhizobium sp. CSA112]|uniref:hypothetical protein n=1 Tax=Bradyrhizobium sp. CSA112 TaxID=2699170 RepID=UPI0023B000A3|nr:hypothetical protein [Bradyrhizobium sp. CSA112]MDE5451336.1 hypothetical protein [Bradyrhizobium sp. CSA112]